MVNSSSTFIKSLLYVKPSQQSQSNSHSCLSFSVATDLLSFAIKLALLSSSALAPTPLWRTTRKTVLLEHQQHLGKRLFGEGVVKTSAGKTLKYSLPNKTSPPWHTNADKWASTEEIYETDFEQNEQTPPTLKSLVWGEWPTGTAHCGHFGVFLAKELYAQRKKN